MYCELQGHEINLTIKVSIKFTCFLIQKNTHSAKFSWGKIHSLLAQIHILDNV